VLLLLLLVPHRPLVPQLPLLLQMRMCQQQLSQ
jgi:hypothetical protein